MATTLLRNGTIIDGSGSPGFPGHVLLRSDRIGAVVRAGQPEPEADVTIDVGGSVIAPGFIDMHSHIDWVVPLERHPALLSCLLEQGVTTAVAGNCGTSPAPIRPETVGRLGQLSQVCTDGPFDYEWRSFGEYLDWLEPRGLAVNMAELVGHAAVRYFATETGRGPLSSDELGRCLDEVRRAFDEGACGLSFGLGYDPGMYSPLEEIEAFCRVAAERGRPATVHLKALSKISPCYPVTSFGAHNVRALREMLSIARETGVSLQLSHFIFVGRTSWPTAARCIEMVDEARSQGLDVMIDAFPYPFGNTTVNVLFPYWFLRQIPRAYESRWAKLRLRVEMAAGFKLVGFGPADMQVMNAGVDGLEELDGRFIDDVAREWGQTSLEVLLRLSKESSGATTILFHGYSGAADDESALESVLAHEACLFETDAIVRSEGYPNAASLGTFPRLLGPLRRDRGLFTLEQAVRRMTSASAQRFGLVDRGTVEEGRIADIVVFDESTIADTPPRGREAPGRPTGIEHVFLGGDHVVADGRYDGSARAGRVLRV